MTENLKISLTRSYLNCLMFLFSVLDINSSIQNMETVITKELQNVSRDVENVSFSDFRFVLVKLQPLATVW